MNMLAKIKLKKDNSEMEKASSFQQLIKGSVIAIIFSIVFLILFAIILTYTEIQESTIEPVVIVITAISILIGSFISTHHIRKNGIINGALVGLIEIIFLYVISSIALTGFSFNMSCFLMILFSILAGMVGGMIGVNIK